MIEQPLRRSQRAALAVRSIPLGLATVLLAFTTGGAFAQVTGKVIGDITDRDTRQPLVGAQVVVEGTNLGNVTSEDGHYFINNVPLGLQRITAQYLGYETRTEAERILAGQTSTIDFALESEVLQAEGIATLIVIEREPLVIRDNTVSKTRFTEEETRNLPIGTVQGVIDLAAGVYLDIVAGNLSILAGDQGGFIVRGGRHSETATYIDGALVTDFTTQRNVSEIGRFGVEEIDVITGGFHAEFGHAQSGVINVVIREGGLDYHGNVRFTTDGHFGTNGYTTAQLADAAEDLVPPNQQDCCGFNQIATSIGGPIIPDKLTFFASAELTGAADFDPHAAGFNPAELAFNSNGSTQTILPGNRGDSTRLQGKLTSFLSGTSKITATYLFSRDQKEFFAHGTCCGILQFFSSAQRVRTHDAILGYDQEIYKTAERSLNLQVRGNWHRTALLQGGFVNPQLAANLVLAGLTDVCGEDCSSPEDTFEDDFLNWRYHDVKFFFEDKFFPGGVTELQKAASGCACPIVLPLIIAPERSAGGADPIFGYAQLYSSSGYGQGMTDREEERWGIRVDLDSQLNRVHRAKAGFEYTLISIDQLSGFFNDLQNSNVFFADPRVMAAYVQDRLDYGDLVIDLGLRVDRWDPNATFPKIAGIVPCEISISPICRQEAELVEAPTKTEWAPRLGVAHPITDATQVRLSYGKFHQLPELRHFFSSMGTDFQAAQNNSNTVYGNPNLDYVETTAFEAGITHLITENLVLDVVGYNRDRRGAIRLDVFQSGELIPEERRIFTNGDNGNVKGFDVTLSKRYSSYFSTDAAVSLQWARGTTSSPTEWATFGGFGRLFDPLFPGKLLTPPSELVPESFDRLLNLNWQFSLSLPGDFREGTALGTVLQDFGLYVVYNAHSGEPWTRRNLTGQGEPLEDIGDSRLPWVHSGDLRVTKGIDILGNFGFEVFATVENFLGIENVIEVNPGSGDPVGSGIEFVASRNPIIPTQFRLDDSESDAFPVALTSLTEEFRGRFARQDRDGNGTITLEEAQQNLFEALIASGDEADFRGVGNGDSPYHYGAPRQIRFGAEVRF